MIIDEAYKAIDLLKKSLPRAFIFVFDTTDRTFIYKSSPHPSAEKFILHLDEQYGIDKLVRRSQNNLAEDGPNLIGLKKIDINTYLGFCIPGPLIHKEDHLSDSRLVLDTLFYA